MSGQEPVLVASWNGGPATARAAELHLSGVPMLDAITRGIALVEDDPEELSVGFGGLPNEDGEVELDAAVMHGPLHRAGAVAGLRRVRHAAALALEVLRRTDHSLLVGEGALKFAKALGFPEENLLTPKAREAWLEWKQELSTRDGWLSPNETKSDFGAARWAGHETNPTPGGPPRDVSPPEGPRPGDGRTASKVPFTYGTIHVSGLDSVGDLYCATSTSGLSYKIAGRTGDSPIVGAGLYAENGVGSAGATGRGEATLQSCAAFRVVMHMSAGMEPAAACLEALRAIAANTREPRLLREAGRPHFNVTLYALRKDGMVGAASLHPGYTYVEQRGSVTRLMKAASLFGG